MKIEQIRNLVPEEMEVKVKELKKELFNLRFQAARGDIQNPSRIKAAKKDIARLLTIKTEKIKADSKKAGK